jgi:phenylacetate-CoA ligase
MLPENKMETADLQYAPLAEQEQFQMQALRQTLSYVQANSPFYKRLFTENKIDPGQIQKLSDLRFLPCTCKEDLQQHNQDFICAPLSEIIEYSATSGTMGTPVYAALTRNDLERLAYNEYLSFKLMGITEHDVVQLMLTLDRQFMAGMAYYNGLRKMGAAIVRTGPGLPPMQIDTALKLKTTTLVAVPSFLLKLIEYCEKEKIDINTLPVKKVLCIGENIRDEKLQPNALAKLITENWKVQLYSTYASTEMQTAFTECSEGAGGHHQPELVIVEILDEKGLPVEAGQYGEVTITTLGIEGTPLIRFRTGDISCLETAQCACGRSTARLRPIAGRKNQMIKLKGTTLYPATIFDLLNHFSNIKEYVVEVCNNAIGTEELTLHISSDIPADECEVKLKPFLQSRLRTIPNIHYHSTSEIIAMQFPSGNRKPFKFIDNRKSV